MSDKLYNTLKSFHFLKSKLIRFNDANEVCKYLKENGDRWEDLFEDKFELRRIKNSIYFSSYKFSPSMFIPPIKICYSIYCKYTINGGPCIDICLWEPKDKSDILLDNVKKREKYMGEYIQNNIYY